MKFRYKLPLILTCVLSTLTSLAQAKEQPNFVLIFADDLGYGDLACFGSETIKTPHLDQMAAEGMRFTDFYAQTVCGPSRAALMTGCYPLRVAQRHNKVDVHPALHSQEITIAEVLKDAGYTSLAIGKWDLAGHTQVSSKKENSISISFPRTKDSTPSLAPPLATTASSTSTVTTNSSKPKQTKANSHAVTPMKRFNLSKPPKTNPSSST